MYLVHRHVKEQIHDNFTVRGALVQWYRVRMQIERSVVRILHWPDTKTRSEIVFPGRPERSFPNVAQWPGEIKMSKGGWKAE